jgi:hypothetical protein
VIPPARRARTVQTRLAHRYLDRVLGAATRDAHVNLAFLKVLQLEAPPATLVRPAILAPALLHGGPRPSDQPLTRPAASTCPLDVGQPTATA